MNTKGVNQRYGERPGPTSSGTDGRGDSPWRVELPRIPRTKSPVPWLTSLHARPGRGPYGDATYRGNCSGLLIEDLLRFFRPRTVLDPMTGGGTCRDVCSSLGIPCTS